MLRKKFRQEKKVILDKEEKDQEIKDKGSLDIDLVNEDPEDIELSKRIRFRSTGLSKLSSLVSLDWVRIFVTMTHSCYYCNIICV